MKNVVAAYTKRILIASLLAFGASSGAAQPKPIDSIDQTELIERINEDSVIPALSVVTGNHLATVDPQGEAQLVATATNGLTFQVNFRACEDRAEDQPRHCRGMVLLSVWDPVPEGAEQGIKSAITDYLIDNPTANAGQLDQGSPFVARYVIADYGAPQGNLVSEFGNFIHGASEFQNAIAQFYSE